MSEPSLLYVGIVLTTHRVEITMSRHHPDLVMCRKQSGIAIGRLCDKCDGKCPVCDSYVRPTTLVRICDECSFGNYQNKCVVCGGEGISDAFYCFECTRLEKDRDGCPKIINLGSSRTDLFCTYLHFYTIEWLLMGFLYRSKKEFSKSLDANWRFIMQTEGSFTSMCYAMHVSLYLRDEDRYTRAGMRMYFVVCLPFIGLLHAWNAVMRGG